MLVSHHHRFIFVKPRKTAGTTVELALSPFLAPGDMATPVGPEESQRRVAPGVRVGRIHRAGRLKWPVRLRDHSTLARAYRVLPDTRDYRVVTMCRNPWDRAVSQFFWSMRHSDIAAAPFEAQKAAFIRYTWRWGRRSWLDPLMGRKRQRLLDSSHLYCIADRCPVGFFVRYEYLAVDLAALAEWLGLADVPTTEGVAAKSGVRPSRRDWTVYFDDATRDLVARECAREIAMFGYDFGGSATPRGPRLHGCGQIWR